MRVIVPRIAFVLLFAATASAQTVSVLPPNAVFSAGAAVVTPCNGCVAVADFNGDGKPISRLGLRFTSVSATELSLRRST